MDFKTHFKAFVGGTNSIHLCAHNGYVSVARTLCVKLIPGFSEEQVRLDREQAAHVVAELTRWLDATAPVDPAYEAWVKQREQNMKFDPAATVVESAEQRAAWEAMRGVLPATDEEYARYLAEGCES